MRILSTGVRQGDTVSVYYDPLIAKLVVWGSNRKEAFSKLHSRLLECHVSGNFFIWHIHSYLFSGIEIRVKNLDPTEANPQTSVCTKPQVEFYA